METDFGETKKVSKDLHTASNMQSCTLFKVSSEKIRPSFLQGHAIALHNFDFTFCATLNLLNKWMLFFFFPENKQSI